MAVYDMQNVHTNISLEAQNKKKPNKKAKRLATIVSQGMGSRRGTRTRESMPKKGGRS